MASESERGTQSAGNDNNAATENTQDVTMDRNNNDVNTDTNITPRQRGNVNAATTDDFNNSRDNLGGTTSGGRGFIGTPSLTPNQTPASRGMQVGGMTPTDRPITSSLPSPGGTPRTPLSGIS